MNILLTSDWQVSLANLDRCEAVLEHLVETARKHRCKYVIHLGDIKDAFNPVDQRVTNFLVHATKTISDICPFLFLAGNHDFISPRDGVPSCLPVLAAAGARVFEQPGGFELDKGVVAWFVPFVRDPAAQLKAFRVVAKKRKTHIGGLHLLFFHNELRGCTRSMYSRGEGITPKDARAHCYDIAVGGHIHHQQSFGKNLWYVGSPFHNDWGEANEQKGSLLLRCDGKLGGCEVVCIPSPLPGWYDPTVPGYAPPKNWRGCRVRIRVPIKLDPSRELAAARKREQEKYPEATLDLVPEFASSVAPSSIDPKGSDKELLLRYLQTTPLPEGVTAEQVAAYIQRYLPHGGAFGLGRLSFCRVDAENTLSYKKAHLQLDRKGITLVTGRNLDWPGAVRSNGSGKTGLLSLPFLPLFGRTLKDQRYDEWACDKTKAPARVALHAVLSDGKKLLVERGRRPGFLRVAVNDRDQTMATETTTQKLVESLTELTWDVLTNSIYIGQSEIGAVFGTAKERKELFSRLLGLDRFIVAQRELRKRLNDCVARKAEIDGEAENTRNLIAEVKRSIADVQSAMGSEPQTSTSDLMHAKAELTKLRREMAALEKANQSEEPWLQENQREFENWLSKTIDAETRWNAAEEQMRTSQKVKSRCPTCGSKVSVAALEAYLAELEEKVKRAEADYHKYEKLQEENRQKRSMVLTEVQERQTTIRKLKALTEVASYKVTKLEQQVEVQERLKATLERSQQRLQKLSKSLKVHEAARDVTAEQVQFLTLCTQAVGRDGLPAYLCSVAVPQLNAAAKRYSQAFAEGEISVQFAFQDGDIDVQIHNLHGGRRMRDQSQGESRVAALIAAFAFRDVLVPHNLLILDEPGEGLDSENARAFAHGLKTVARRFGSVFVTSHNPFFLSELEPDYHLEVTKQNGISEVKEV